MKRSYRRLSKRRPKSIKRSRSRSGSKKTKNSRGSKKTKKSKKSKKLRKSKRRMSTRFFGAIKNYMAKRADKKEEEQRKKEDAFFAANKKKLEAYGQELKKVKESANRALTPREIEEDKQDTLRVLLKDFTVSGIGGRSY